MQSDDSSSSHRGALSLLTPIGASYYARSKSLGTQHYQQLMDRGWRRSGTLLYLPDASRSCCPHYTIRPSRDQRQTLHRWNRHVLGERYMSEASVRYPLTREEKRRQRTGFDLASAVHESESAHLRPGIEPAHRFEISLEPDAFSVEKFALFSDYQRHVHHEGDSDISEASFRRFLCSSPLVRTSRYGSFHQCYRLDGRLIAMAVLDLLPHAVSGVYFVYHRDFEQWSLGKLSALREAALALEGGHEFYYMGYYIHGCKKMVYKAAFQPQYVLDYHSMRWDVLDADMRALMDRRKYASMSRERARRAAVEERRARGVAHAGSAGEGVGAVEDDDGEEEEEEDDDEEVLHPHPLQATASELSMLSLRVPGVMSLEEMREHIDLDRMKIYLGGHDGVWEAQYIVAWKDGNVLDPTSLKGVFAEFAAAVGPDVAREIVVDFSS